MITPLSHRSKQSAAACHAPVVTARSVPVVPRRQFACAHAASAVSTAGRCQSYRAAADPVVSTQWLAQHLDDVTVLDVRGRVDTEVLEPGVEKSAYLADYEAYLEGHIPGAVFWDWTRDAIDAAAAAPVQMQMSADLLAPALEARGVSSDQPVLAYDDGDGMLAARLWWMLTVAGHASAHVLEGGWAKWRAERRATELHEPCTLKVYGCFEADLQPGLHVTLEEMRGLQQQQQPSGPVVVLLDTRNAQQYTGEVRRGPRGGHIPGAASLPRAALLDPATGWLRPLEQQRQLLQQAGVLLPSGGSTQQQQEAAACEAGAQQRVLLYCNGGVAACTAALALHRLGHRGWAVYDGSWNEYSSSDLPVGLPGT